ncbi:MAG: 2-isopropylmalate synthase [Natronospirillum sp.]
MSTSDHLVIFDTTLRDGEQSPGASMTLEEKVRIATSLEKMKVDVIEAGFAAASPGDFDAIQAIAQAVKDSTICSLARATDGDLERAAGALKGANRARIHTFIATSPIHMKYKLQMEPDQVVERAVHAVKKARGYVDDVEFSCEDAGRSEVDFLCRIIEQAINAGATTINIPDTVGYAIPEQFGDLIAQLMNRIPNADKAIFSVHCHNDLGLAVANSLAAVSRGARQVECTINGLGERAGNASLEEIVMAVRTRPDLFAMTTQLDTRMIVPTSRLVSSVTGFPVQPNKAIVGANAFAHEAGIHQDGVLKHRETYEIMKAEDVGWHTNRMVLGKHSGRNALKARFEELGYVIADEHQLMALFGRFKDLADRKHEIFDEDLHALLSESGPKTVPERYSLSDMSTAAVYGGKPTATIKLKVDGVLVETNAEGDGQVDASFKAIEKVVQSGANLQIFSVNAVTEGTESQGESTVRLEKGGRIVNGKGADTDIVVSAVKAYIHALNLLTQEGKLNPQITV